MDTRISIDTQIWISQGRETIDFNAMSGAALTTTIFFTRRLNLQRVRNRGRLLSLHSNHGLRAVSV